jgi:ring-1,2-phenylacetyl-CoA epoxidase subunit PaaA
MAQDALNRFWYPSLMMFGPSDADSVHSAESMAWKIKINTNDELRQKFVDQTVPQAEYAGSVGSGPGADVERGPRASRFLATRLVGVLRRDPGRTARAMPNGVEARQKAWDDGAWVRE